ncbi:MAG TPA: PAS domain S-box protein [Candidatus Dormibacteraeota bacterium]|nr:PAS domain S-box protein [Candidatus Dormibacteraeota bacterium]
MSLLAAIVDSSDDAIISKTLDGRITSWNTAAEAMYGYTADEAVGRPIELIIPPDRDGEMESILARIRRGERVDHHETVRLRKDGRPVPVSLTVSPVHGVDGTPVGASSISRDITERKKTQAKFEGLLEAAPDAMVGVHRDGTIAFVNHQAEALFGYSRHELLHRPIETLVPARLGGIHPQHRDKYFANPQVRPMGVGLNLSGRRKDGSEFPAEISLSSITTEEGLLVTAAVRDVTAQKQASQYARSLIEASLDPLVTISVAGKITDVNEATIRATGVPRDRLIGTDFSDYFTDPEDARRGYRRVFAEGSVTDYPLTIRHRNGAVTDVLYNASVFRDTLGEVLGVFAAARDVTAQRRAEAEIAEQRARELERLAELERFQRLTVGRELKMIELKKEIAELRDLLGPDGRETP